MALGHRKIKEKLAAAGKRLRSEIVQPVPLELARCEFDCEKQECMMDEWETCERRLAFSKMSSKRKC